MRVRVRVRASGQWSLVSGQWEGLVSRKVGVLLGARSEARVGVHHSVGLAPSDVLACTVVVVVVSKGLGSGSGSGLGSGLGFSFSFDVLAQLRRAGQ